MNKPAKAVLGHLHLKEAAEGSYSTVYRNEGFRQVDGGQLMAQALAAASRTVSVDKNVGSYQSIFYSPADISKRIDY